LTSSELTLGQAQHLVWQRDVSLAKKMNVRNGGLEYNIDEVKYTNPDYQAIA